MRNVWTIARRELRLYFISPIAYIIGLLILLVTGIYFTLIVYLSSRSAYTYGYATPPGIDGILGVMVFLFLLSLPALTMRLMADEHRAGTLELLLTSPIKDYELVFGKWLGAFVFILMVIAITMIYPIVLNSLVTNGIDQGTVASSYLALILVAATFLSIGTAISSFFNNQFAAFFATIVVLFFFWWVIGWPAAIMQQAAGSEIFTYLSMSSHFYDSMMVGKITLGDIVYYLSLTGLGLFLGTVAVEIRRWQ